MTNEYLCRLQKACESLPKKSIIRSIQRETVLELISKIRELEEKLSVARKECHIGREIDVMLRLRGEWP